MKKSKNFTENRARRKIYEKERSKNKLRTNNSFLCFEKEIKTPSRLKAINSKFLCGKVELGEYLVFENVLKYQMAIFEN